MKAITVYEKETGRITRTIRCASVDIDLNLPTDGSPYIMEYAQGSTHYIYNDMPKKREENPTSLKGLVLTNVPKNSKILIEEEYYENDKGEDVTLSFNFPGKYLVTIMSFPYLDKEFEIDYQP